MWSVKFSPVDQVRNRILSASRVCSCVAAPTGSVLLLRQLMGQ